MITSDFVKYPCFYCDEEIIDLKILQKHQDKCTETGIVHEQIADQKDNCPVLDMAQDDCDQCGAKFEYRTDLIEHFKHNHPEVSIVWCDFCQAGFEAIEELQCHIRVEHRNYLPG